MGTRFRSSVFGGNSLPSPRSGAENCPSTRWKRGTRRARPSSSGSAWSPWWLVPIAAGVVALVLLRDPPFASDPPSQLAESTPQRPSIGKQQPLASPERGNETAPQPANAAPPAVAPTSLVPSAPSPAAPGAALLATPPAESTGADLIQPHPITRESAALMQQRHTFEDVKVKLRARDFASARSLIRDNRQTNDANTWPDFEAGYTLIADCLERPSDETRQRAATFIETHRVSPLRRQVRRACLDPS
jgi:hypothetical protein